MKPTEGSIKQLNFIVDAMKSGILKYDSDGQIWCKIERNCRGYIQIYHKRSRSLAHRVIWVFFNGPMPKDMEINHIDGNKTNNRNDNLELVTRSGNMLHLSRTVGMPWTKDRRRGGKLSDEQIRSIRDFLDDGSMSQKQIAAHFGICQQLVSSISTGKRFNLVQ